MLIKTKLIFRSKSKSIDGVNIKINFNVLFFKG